MIKHRLLVALFASMAVTGWSQDSSIIVESYADGLNSDSFTQVDGKWNESVAKSTADGLRATKSYYNDADSEPATARFTPDLPAAGKYEVLMTYPQSGNASDVKYTIKSADGEHVLTITQSGREASHQPAANQWYSLGVYNFEAGKNGYVEVSDPLTGDRPMMNEPNARIYVDAIRFLPVSDSTPVTASTAAPTAPEAATTTETATADTATTVAPLPGSPIPAEIPPSLPTEVAAVTPTAPSLPPTEATAAAGAALPALPATTPAAGAALPSLPAEAPATDSTLPSLPAATPAAGAALPGLPAATPAGAALPALPAAPADAGTGLPGLPAATPDADPGLPALPPADPTPTAGLPGLPAVNQAAELPALPGATGTATPAPGLPALPTAPDAAALPNLPATGATVTTTTTMESTAVAANLPSLAPVTPTPVRTLPSPSDTPVPSISSTLPGLYSPTVPTPAPGAGLAVPTPVSDGTALPTVTPSVIPGGYSITQFNPSNLQWMYDYGAALNTARSQDKKVLIFFTAEHNKAAQSYETEVFTDPTVRQELAKYVLVKIDFPRSTRLAYGLGVFGAGVIAVVDASGTVTSRVIQKPSTTSELLTQLASPRAVRATPIPVPQNVPAGDPTPTPAIGALPDGMSTGAATDGMPAMPGIPGADAVGTPGITAPPATPGIATPPPGPPAMPGAPAAAPADATVPGAPAPAPAEAPAPPAGTAADALPGLPGA